MINDPGLFFRLNLSVAPVAGNVLVWQNIDQSNQVSGF
jgi:hypothetical protein